MEEWEESEDEEWGGGGGEGSVTVAGRLARRTLEGLVRPEEQVVTQEGEVQGGEGVPKLIGGSALKQAWREEEKRECEVLWRRSPVGAGLRSVDPRPPAPLSPLSELQRLRRHQTLPPLNLFGAAS
jgi:hypothetical protein